MGRCFSIYDIYYVHVPLSKAPGAAPLNLVVTNTSSTRLNASWNAPPWDLTYGYIRYYIIKYLEVQCSGYSYGAVKSTARNKTVGGDVNSVMLENLDVWKCYQVNVTAYTVGEGPYATVEETRTSEEGCFYILYNNGEFK